MSRLNRLHIALASVTFLTLPTLGLAQGPGLASFNGTDGTQLRMPSRPLLPNARIPKAGKQFDALSSTDFYQFVTQGRERLSNPDIAVGPDDIFVIAGQNRIMRVGNPNAQGLPQYGAGQFSPANSPLVNYQNLKNTTHTSEVFLDTWVGTNVLADICPGQFNPSTCLIQFPTVRYDQMHGHFLIAFAITDTGARGIDNQVTAGRASTWILIISKGASFVNADLTLAAPPGTSNVFTPPLPPPDITGGGNNTGGINAGWGIYYGARDSEVTAGGNLLNLNMYSTHPTALPLSAPGRYSESFPESNCNAPTGALLVPPKSVSVPRLEETVCLFPTEVRVGIDNDSVILVSPVVNVNQRLLIDNSIPYTTGRYAGNRVRVLSKYYLYNFLNLTNGNPFAPGAYAPLTIGNYNAGGGALVAQPTAAEFDMFRDTDLPAFCSVFDYATDTCTTTVTGFPPRRYTLGLEVSLLNSGIDSPRPPLPAVNPSTLRPLYYEPVHLRGRTLAKYSNYTFGGLTQLIGSWANNLGTGGNLWVQTIVYRPDYKPALDPGDQTQILINGPRLQMVPDTAQNPRQVPQAVTCSTTPCSTNTENAPENNLYVGDGRPRRAIYREGHIYDARAGRGSTNLFGTSIGTTDGAPDTANDLLRSTVYYDVIQTIYSSAIPALPAIGSTAPWDAVLGVLQPNPSLIWYTFWQNGHFYAPMFDVTANVQRYGATSPSWLLPYFEKLFVGTTSPRAYYPNVSNQGNIWPSLFDVRQGVDKYDRFESFRDPQTGRIANPITEAAGTNVMVTRAGAATDPNLGGLWVYGAFSNYRIAGGVGQWSTNAAYYDMSFADTDPYGTEAIFFADVCPPAPALLPEGCTEANRTPFFIYIQTARQLGLTVYLNSTSGALGAATAGNPPHGQNGTKPNFNPNATVNRAEMASFIVYSQFDPTTVTDFLTKTGGDTFSSFADVPFGGGNVGVSGDPNNPGTTGNVTAAQQKAIEVMYRRGYTRGCLLTTDGVAAFCPLDLTTRGQMGVFIIRAKMNNVHPTVLSGCPASSNPAPAPPFGCTQGGDKFFLFQTANAYFPGDTPTTHPFYAYIQKMRELRITNGNGVNGAGAAIYGSSLALPVPADSQLTRGQLATFIVRAFHF